MANFHSRFVQEASTAPPGVFCQCLGLFSGPIVGTIFLRNRHVSWFYYDHVPVTFDITFRDYFDDFPMTVAITLGVDLGHFPMTFAIFFWVDLGHFPVTVAITLEIDLGHLLVTFGVMLGTTLGFDFGSFLEGGGGTKKGP